MQLKQMFKIVEALLSKFPPDAEVWIDDENIAVFSEGEKHFFDPEDVFSIENDAEINWDGISAVRAWKKGGKQRIYFKAVGIPEGAHRSGKVFLELVNGSWMPNMRYGLMVNLANQLDEAKIFDADVVAEKYQEYIDSF